MLTNFSKLTSEQLTVWSRTTWREARKASFMNRFVGNDEASMIHRIDELTKDERGARAVITLVADLEGDGTAGDSQLEGNEEEIKAYDDVIQIDMLRHANRHKGEMTAQRSVVRFRESSRSVLAYWLADRMDQMAFLTLSGELYSQSTDGTTRTGSQLTQLDFASDVTSPTAGRYFNWDNTTTDTLIAGNTATVAAGDTPDWNMLLAMRTKAQRGKIKPIRGEGGTAYYNVFMSPEGIEALKKDSTFLAAHRDALPRAKSNPLFQGADVWYVDGLAIYSFEHVYHSDTWGSGGNISGQACLMCGAQALGFADIGDAKWVEKEFDYDNQPGISYGKIFGFKKPVFRSIFTGIDEDFGVIRVNTAV